MGIFKSTKIEPPAASRPLGLPTGNGLGAAQRGQKILERYRAYGLDLSGYLLEDELARILAKESGRKKPRNLPKLVEAIADHYCFGEFNQLGEGVGEISTLVRSANPKEFPSLIEDAMDEGRGLEIGYFSTRLDLAGNPISEPRAYRGMGRSFENGVLSLKTAFGKRSLKLSSMVWVSLVRRHETKLSVIEFTRREPGVQAQYSFRFLGENDLKHDFRGDLTEEARDYTPPNEVESQRFITPSHRAPERLAALLNETLHVESFNPRERTTSAILRVSSVIWRDEQLFFVSPETTIEIPRSHSLVRVTRLNDLSKDV